MLLLMLDLNETVNVIQGILFLSPLPVSRKDLTDNLKVDSALVEQAIIELAKRLEGGGLELIKVAGGYELVTRKEYSEHLRAFFGKLDSTKLSRAALETLAIITYQQPVTRNEIESVRGVNSSGVLKSLIDKGLVKITGKSDAVGRPFLFSTTEDFLRYLGIDSLDELPELESFEKKF